jgi:lipopolysaccharide transport system ATP-binding protein
MPPIIHVENLGKKYAIHHQGAGGHGYRRLSEDLVEAIKRPFRSLLSAPRSLAPDTSHLTPASSSEEFWALRNVSFEVSQGEVLGIIGRNGAGKSTLLKILSRITEPTEGRVHLKGRVASLLEVGTGFHPELTGRENVFLNGAILGMSRAEIRRKFDEIVAFAEVEKFLDTPVKRYSSGMYVRLAFAVAAHLEPEILVVDEVLAVGDASFQKKCLGKMSEVSHGGRTVLFVSHSMAVLQGLCPRAIWLDQGRLMVDGPVLETVSQYSGSASAGHSGNGELQPIGDESRARLRNLTIRAPEWSSNSKVPCNGRIEVSLSLEVPQRIPHMHFALRLNNHCGVTKATITSREHCCPDLGRAGKYEIRIAVPAFPCTPGTYDWTLELYGDLLWQPFLKYERLCEFEVCARSLPGASHPYEPRHGDFILDGSIAVSHDGTPI